MSDFFLSRDDARELDRRAAEEYGLAGVVLMENAGRGCAELVTALNPERKPVVVLCGPGNNGGDGFVLARHLDNRGWPVTAWLVRPEPEGRSFGFGGAAAATDRRLSPDCEANLVAWAAGHPLGTNDGPGDGWKEALAAEVAAAGWVVDALFGTGLSRPLGPPYHELIPFLNAAGKPILAVDLPSGLDCDGGKPLGPCLRAAHTATFVGPKKGFAEKAAAEWHGEVHVIDIGAPRKLVDEFRKRAGDAK